MVRGEKLQLFPLAPAAGKDNPFPLVNHFQTFMTFGQKTAGCRRGAGSAKEGRGKLKTHARRAAGMRSPASVNIETFLYINKGSPT